MLLSAMCIYAGGVLFLLHADDPSRATPVGNAEYLFVDTTDEGQGEVVLRTPARTMVVPLPEGVTFDSAAAFLAACEAEAQQEAAARDGHVDPSSPLLHPLPPT